MTFWIKTENGETIKLKDRSWRARIYAAGRVCDDPEYLFNAVRESGLVSSVNIVQKRKSIFDWKRSSVAEIELARAGNAKKVADLLESVFQNPSEFQLFNVDVLPEQQYFFDHEAFPLAYVNVSVDGVEVTKWRVHDAVESLNYDTPPLKILKLGVRIGDRVPRLSSKLDGITLSPVNCEESTGPVEIQSREESQILSDAIEQIGRFDPDVILTQNGDTFVLPFLFQKARKYNIDLKLNRDTDNLNFIANGEQSGKTYFSYGRILYRPSTQKLFGRIHLDEQNTFIYDQCRFEGLFEISRLCRMPLHIVARASIGKCLSGLQFYYAFKRDTLIPYKPTIAEQVKSFYDLLIQDRGGLVFVPLQGVFERVCEIDFASLYPNIINGHNISAETVNCSCCPDSDNRIEELRMHICKKKHGIVPQSLELPLSKRLEYKLLRDSANDKELKRAYNERAGALKWILVTSFGYLSYRNAKFGKIDSHIAVCSIARKTLLDATHTAENRGYRVIHGIVDSLWLYKERAGIEDYKELVTEIENSVKFKLSIEGIYKWLVFLPSKVDSQNQVANRYFGCFENNEIKVRGIEYRRHDTPFFFKACQEQILKELAKCNNEEELVECSRTRGVSMFRHFAKQLEDHAVPATELIITRRLSKDLDEYNSKRQLSVNAALKLRSAGLKLQAGQSVSYVITSYASHGMSRTLPEELADGAEYDSQRYVELLADCCATILSPLGVSKEMLLTGSDSLLNWA